jgi:vancomycin permeability regulator SanA
LKTRPKLFSQALLVVITFALAVVTIMLVDGLMLITQRGDPQTQACTNGTAFVLGAAQYDGTPSPVFQRRLDAALDLYNDGCVSRILVSGGGQPGDATTEAASGLAYLTARGVPTEHIAVEPTATSTYEAVSSGLPLITARPIVVVTDAYHGRRVAWVFDRFGEDVTLNLVPFNGSGATHYVREVVALTAYRLAYGWPWQPTLP